MSSDSTSHRRARSSSASASSSPPTLGEGWTPSRAFLQAQVTLLERIARGASSDDLLEDVVHLVEREIPELRASVLAYDEKTNRLAGLSAPNLPASYLKAMNGLEAGPSVGTCGTAAYTGKIVITEDVRTDPRWAGFRELVEPYGLRACWSSPIRAAGDAVVGTFALYRTTPGRPTDREAGIIEDATHLASLILDREHQLQTLAEANAHYEQVVEQPGILVHRFLPDTTELFVGPEYASLLSTSADALVGTRWIEEVAPSKREALLAMLHALTPEAPTSTHEDEFPDANGTVHWIRWHNRGFFGPDGRLRYIQSVGVDLTEQHAMEAALRENELRFRQIAGSIDEAFWLRTQHEMLYVNEAYETIFGQSADVLMQRPNAYWDRVHPHDRDRLADRVARLYADGVPMERVEYRITHPSRGTRWIRVSSSRISTAAGPPRYTGVANDVTAERNAEAALIQQKEALQQQTEILQKIVDHVPVIIAFFDADGQFLLVNQEWESVLGWSIDAMEGVDIMAEFYPDPADRREVLDFMMEAPPEWRDFRTRTRDGRIIDTSWTNVRLSDGRRIGIGLDVSRRKQYERGLIAAKEAAEEVSRLKSSMLANMSHEVRTPLTAVIGFAEVLEEACTGEHARFAHLIRRSSRRLMQTLDSVLQLSKLEAGTQALDGAPMDLVAQAREGVDEQQVQAHQKGVLLHQTGIASCPGTWDRGAIQRILANLIDNAIKFTEPGGSVTVHVEANDHTAALQVIDTGIGIHPDFQASMFHAFKQESDGLQRSHEGSGLGLAIVKKLVALLDASIHVASTPGEGTTITVILPRDSRSPTAA